MRKYLIVAVAALTAVSFAAVSYAQGTDTATLETSIKPGKAGTKKKPKHVTLDLNVVNGNTSRTMSELDVFIPKNVKVSLKGMPSCARADIAALACPKSAELGNGEARAMVGVNGPTPTPLTFEVTAFKTKNLAGNKDMLAFFIDDGAALKFLTETSLNKASGKYGQRLNIEVPELAQHVGTAFNGLVSLHTTLGKKKGKNALMTSIGCAAKKHPFKVDLTFIENQVTRPAVISKSATSKCSK